jgi:hypothetical protein
MKASTLIETLEQLRDAGMTNDLLTKLKGQRVTINKAIWYFQRHEPGYANLAFGDRCAFVAEKVRSGERHLPQLVSAALSCFPLAVAPVTARLRTPRATMAEQRNGIQTGKELGDAGEKLAVDLLSAWGYSATCLPTNNRTYDIRASRNGMEFFVSVKVSRNRAHVRLGSRRSVSRLSQGNFVFAFLPKNGQHISLAAGDYRLWIIPAEVAKTDSLKVYDAYWSAKGSNEESYSVIIKGYDRNQREIWNRWGTFENAWHLLP